MDVTRAARDVASRVQQNAASICLVSSILVLVAVALGWLFGESLVRSVFHGNSWLDPDLLLSGRHEHGVETYAARFRQLISLATVAAAGIITVLLICWIAVRDGSAAGAAHGQGKMHRSSTTLCFVILASYSLFLTLVYYLVTALPGTTYVSVWTNDLFIFFDGAHRMSRGQVPHLDFHTPIGTLAYALPLAGLKLRGGFVGSMEAAGLIVNAFILLSASRILSSRYSLPLSILTLLFLSLIIVVPMNMGDSSGRITFAMFYNRYGWAALTVLFLCFHEPRSSGRVYWDAVVVALLLAFLFYLKITYFVVGLVFLPILAWGPRHNLRLVACASLLLGLIVILGSIGLGNSAGYLRDIMTSVHSSGALRGDLFHSALRNVTEYFLTGLVISIVILMRRADIRYVIFVLYVCGSGLAILDQNAQWQHVVTLLAVLLVSHEVFARSDIGASATIGDAQPKSVPIAAFVFALTLMFLATPVSARIGALVLYAKEINKAETPDLEEPQASIAALSRLRTGEQFSALTDVLREEDPIAVFYKIRNYPTKQRLSQREYMETIVDGYELLGTIDVGDDSVSVLDMVNPYSFLLDIEPPTGDYSFVDKNRNIRKDIHIPAETVFGSSRYVMRPKFPLNFPTARLLEEIYGPYIDSEYERVGESDFWYLHARRR